MCVHAQLHQAVCNFMDYVAHQALLSMEFSQARILEGFAISYFGGSSLPRYQTLVSCVSCIASGFFTPVPHLYWCFPVVYI